MASLDTLQQKTRKLVLDKLRARKPRGLHVVSFFYLYITAHWLEFRLLQSVHLVESRPFARASLPLGRILSKSAPLFSTDHLRKTFLSLRWRSWTPIDPQPFFENVEDGLLRHGG
jgi:hypothetical protein